MNLVADVPHDSQDSHEPDRAGSSGAGTPDEDRVAVAVETVVVAERGQWAVDIVVVFNDGVVRRRIDTYPTKARAEIYAGLIRRGADRELRGPLNG